MPGRNELVGWGWAGKGYGQHVATRYRIYLSDVVDMFHKQDGKCPGCLRELAHPTAKELRTGLRPEVDHRHRFDTDGNALPCEREDVRGLLCMDCNHWIGRLADDPQRVTNLGKYLLSHGDSSWENSPNKT
jgi:hypothetical protein